MAKHYRSMLQDRNAGPIDTAGGVVYVAVAGGSAKVALTDKDGATIANPVPLVNGVLDFHIADSINAVDFYGMAPGGQAFERKSVKASGPNDIFIDIAPRAQTLRIPFNIDDTTDAVETDTGFDLPDKAVLAFGDQGIDVEVIDASETIDVGLLSTESGGDANEFMTLAALGVLGVVLDTDKSAGYVTGAVTSKSISYTLTSGTDTAAGYMQMSYTLYH